MNRDDLRAFALRDWKAAARAKQDFWAEQYRRSGSAPARQAAAQLFDHARRIGVPLLAPAQRDADLAHHVDLRRRLDAAARAAGVRRDSETQLSPRVS